MGCNPFGWLIAVLALMFGTPEQMDLLSDYLEMGDED